MVAAIIPVTTPRTKYPRARRFFLSSTADAMKPQIAPAPAITATRISCNAPAAIMLPDQTTVIAGREVRAHVRDQTEDEALPLYATACNVMSEIDVRLWPSVVPKVEIHTSTFDVSVRLPTSMRLCPGCSDVVGVSSVVSANLAGFSVGDERIWTFVPVLDTSIVTALSAVGSDKCSKSPSP